MVSNIRKERAIDLFPSLRGISEKHDFSPMDLLKLAIDKKLRVCAPIPDGTNILGVDIHLLKKVKINDFLFRQKMQTTLAESYPSVRFVVLSESTLNFILSENTNVLCEFFGSGIERRRNSWVEVFPREEISKKSSFMPHLHPLQAIFAIHREDALIGAFGNQTLTHDQISSLVELGIGLDNLFIAPMDYEILLESLTQKKIEQAPLFFVRKPHTSMALIQLNEVFNAKWRNLAGTEINYDAWNMEVEQELAKLDGRFKGGKNVRMFGANFIKPKNFNVIKDSKKKDIGEGLPGELFKELIIASDKFWGGTEYGNGKKPPVNVGIEQHLKSLKNVKFSQKAAAVGAAIINPNPPKRFLTAG